MWTVILPCSLYLLIIHEASGDACTQYGVSGLTHQSKCYVKSSAPETRENAQQSCITTGGALVAVTDKATHEFLVTRMKADSWGSAWTGLKLSITPWTWMSAGVEQIANEQGCYKDIANERDLTEKMNIDQWRNSPEQIPTQCQALCKKAGHSYAGVQYTQSEQKYNCFCGGSFGKHGQSRSCNVRCNMLCGGDTKNQVYAVSGSVASDLGCYADNSTARDLNFGMNVDKWKSSPNEIPAQCQKLCKDNSYTYAGVQSAKGQISCYCGNSYGKYGQTTGCNNPCSTTPSSVKCGGVDSNYVYYIDGAYSGWTDGQPNGAAEGQHCALMYQRNDFDLADYACNIQARFACQLPVANCTLTNTNHERHSFVSNVTDVCIYMSTEFKSWDKSRGDCKDRGGDLVTVTNKALHNEMKKMAQTLATSHGAEDDQYWVALTSGRWQQSDGSRLSQYSAWRYGYPTPDLGYACAVVDKDAWINTNCSASHHYFCEMDVTVATQPPTTTTTSAATSSGTTSSTTELVITGSGATPDTGASTSNSGLTTFQIVLIFVLVLLACAIVLAVGVFIYYKKKHGNKQVAPSKYDTGENGLPPPTDDPKANGLAVKDGTLFRNGHTNGTATHDDDIYTGENGKWNSKRIYVD